MSALAGLPVLTGAEIRAAEERAVTDGAAVSTLMERAGAGVARWTARLAGGAPILVLCGPGNNGGDGYVAARLLAAGGADVRVAALGEPRSDAAQAAAAGWAGPVTTLDDAQQVPVVVDALLGTGANRAVADPAPSRLIRGARLALAVDLPSGLDADSGQALGEVTPCHVTLALGALKPAHMLYPGAALCGVVRWCDLGLAPQSDVTVLAPPTLLPPAPDAHKYSRGMVAVVAGAMAGASLLAAEASLRSGAGYVALLGGEADGGPQALVHRSLKPETLADERIGCVLVGPGLGRDADARQRLHLALAAGRSLVIDGDALHLFSADAIPADSILTPHAGEFEALFGASAGSKLDRTRAAARSSGAVIVHKGPDTVIAAPDGHVVIAPSASSWLSTAGTGDVLAGTIAAQRAGGADPFTAAQAGVWLHGRAAGRLGGAFVADDLARVLSVVRGEA